jgi:ADP-ribosylglycohydrolase
MRFEQRVIACFQALAIGDAVGKQTETLTTADVRRWYPDGISGFHGRPGDVIPRYAGKRYQWRIGETTDDTEQTFAVIRAILRDRAVRHESVGRELLQCRKSLHPGVSLWNFIQHGDPAYVAVDGEGCGAAMRAAPVGVLYRTSQLDELRRAAYECAIATHGGQLAIDAAGAVAGAVSAALEGQSPSDILAVALRAAGTTSTIAQSIERVHADPSHPPFPDRPETIVPLAISLALATRSAEQTTLIAANIGGDSDSVASIGSAIAGAIAPETVNADWFKVVKTINPEYPWSDLLRDLCGSLS